MNENHDTDWSEDEGIKLLDILQTLADNARLLVFGPLIFGLIALGVTFVLKPEYIGKTSILVPQQQQGVAASMLAQISAIAGMAGMGGAAAGLRNSAEMYVGLLRSRTITDRMIDRFKGMEVWSSVKTRDDARKVMARISEMTVRRDGQITIEVVGPSPQWVAAVANAYVEELTSLTARLAVTEAQQRRQFLEKQLTKAKENLVRAEIALGSVGVSENVLKFNPSALGEGVATLMAKKAAKEVQLSSMRGYLTENSPDFRQAQQELAAIQEQLGKLEHPRPTGDNAEYISLYREFKYNETLFEQLAKQYEMARIDESSEGAVIQVVDVAVPPDNKANTPKALVAILAWLVAGVVLVLFVFVRRALINVDGDTESVAKLAAIRSGFARVLKPWRRYANTGRDPAN